MSERSARAGLCLWGPHFAFCLPNLTPFYATLRQFHAKYVSGIAVNYINNLRTFPKDLLRHYATPEALSPSRAMKIYI